MRGWARGSSNRRVRDPLSQPALQHFVWISHPPHMEWLTHEKVSFKNITRVWRVGDATQCNTKPADQLAVCSHQGMVATHRDRLKQTKTCQNLPWNWDGLCLMHYSCIVLDRKYFDRQASSQRTNWCIGLEIDPGALIHLYNETPRAFPLAPFWRRVKRGRERERERQRERERKSHKPKCRCKNGHDQYRGDFFCFMICDNAAYKSVNFVIQKKNARAHRHDKKKVIEVSCWEWNPSNQQRDIKSKHTMSIDVVVLGLSGCHADNIRSAKMKRRWFADTWSWSNPVSARIFEDCALPLRYKGDMYWNVRLQTKALEDLQGPNV